MAEPDDANPYRSPSASEMPTEPTQKLFPWQRVPAIVLCLYGGLLVLWSVVTVVFNIGSQFVELRSLPLAIHFWVLIGSVSLLGVHGYLAIAVGRHLWKRHWRRSAVTFASAIVLLILGSATLYIGFQVWGR